MFCFPFVSECLHASAAPSCLRRRINDSVGCRAFSRASKRASARGWLAEKRGRSRVEAILTPARRNVDSIALFMSSRLGSSLRWKVTRR